MLKQYIKSKLSDIALSIKEAGEILKYAAVIVTYNRKEMLTECIMQVLNQTIPFTDIYIVDNCSTDGTSCYLDDLTEQLQQLHVIHEQSNIGGAGGFHDGLKAAAGSYDYVLIIDDDAMIALDYIEKIQNHMIPGVLAYSGSVYTNEVIDTSHRRRLCNQILMRKKDVTLAEYDNERFCYDLSTFCGLLISRDIIEKIGLPEKDYYIWYDDTEFCLRFKEYTPICNVNSAVLNHKTKPNPQKRLDWKSYYGYRNRWDVGMKYSQYPAIYELYEIAFHLSKILVYTLKQLKRCERVYSSNMVRLHMDVLRFVFDRKLGKNPKYTSNTKL